MKYELTLEAMERAHFEKSQPLKGKIHKLAQCAKIRFLPKRLMKNGLMLPNGLYHQCFSQPPLNGISRMHHGKKPERIRYTLLVSFHVIDGRARLVSKYILQIAERRKTKVQTALKCFFAHKIGLQFASF